jgi:hypothetical protein
VTGPGESGGPDGQVRPRGQVNLEELAHLDAGLLTKAQERELLGRIAGDPDAAELLAVFDQVDTELGELGERDEDVPEDVVARLDAAIAAEFAAADGDATNDSTNAPADSPATPAAPDPAEAAPVVDLAEARAAGRTGARRGRTGRSRTRRWATAGLSVAAAAVVAVVIGGVARETLQTPQPQPGSAPAPTLTVADLPAQWPGLGQFRDLGFLADPGALRQCLFSSGAALVPPDQLLGARPVVVDGQYGVLVAVPQDPAAPDGEVRLIVLGPHCDSGTGESDVIAEAVVPR